MPTFTYSIHNINYVLSQAVTYSSSIISSFVFINRRYLIWHLSICARTLFANWSRNANFAWWNKKIRSPIEVYIFVLHKSGTWIGNQTATANCKSKLLSLVIILHVDVLRFFCGLLHTIDWEQLPFCIFNYALCLSNIFYMVIITTLFFLLWDV